MQCVTFNYVLAYAVGALVVAPTPAGQHLNPLALLRGAAAARGALKTGHLEIAYAKGSHRPNPGNSTLTLEFDGAKWTAVQTSDLFFINPGKERAFDALGGDRKEAERRGIGKTTRTRIAFGWDGEKLTNYWSGSVQANYRNPASQMAEYYFDPRTLGVNIYHSFSVKLDDCLGLSNPRLVELVGEERVGDRVAWRVKVINANDAEFHYWVEGQSPFRVLREKYFGSNESAVLESKYDDTTDSPLPMSELLRWYDKSGQLTNQVTMKVMKMELNRPISDEVGTMASLGVPPGTEVFDDVANKRLGYWNGAGISATRAEAIQKTVETITGVPQQGGSSVWYWVIGGTVLTGAAVGAVVWWRKRVQQANA